MVNYRCCYHRVATRPLQPHRAIFPLTTQLYTLSLIYLQEQVVTKYYIPAGGRRERSRLPDVYVRSCLRYTRRYDKRRHVMSTTRGSRASVVACKARDFFVICATCTCCVVRNQFEWILRLYLAFLFLDIRVTSRMYKYSGYGKYL